MFVYYSLPNVLTVALDNDENFMFVPGNNEVPKKTWDAMQKNPNFVRRLKSGVLKVTSEFESKVSGDEDDDTDGESPLAALGSAEAKNMVRDTYDPVLLRKWKLTENRKTVAAVIDEQLEAADKRIAENSKKKRTEDE